MPLCFRKLGQAPLLKLSFLLFLILSPLGQVAAAGDRSAARASFLKARQLHVELEKRPVDKVLAKDILAVIGEYRKTVAADPSYEAVDDALLAMAQLYRHLGAQFGASHHFRRALDAARFLIKEYPASPLQDGAWLEIGILYQEHLLDRDSALHAFEHVTRKYPGGEAARLAAERIKKLNTPALMTAADGRSRAVNNTARPELATVQEIRYWSNQDYTRVVIRMDREAEFDREVLTDPPRIYFDLKRTQVAPGLNGKSYVINDLFIKQVRIAQNRADRVRVVLDFDKINEPTIFALYNPFRLVIDTRRSGARQRQDSSQSPDGGTSSAREVSKPGSLSKLPAPMAPQDDVARFRTPVVTRADQAPETVQTAVLPLPGEKKTTRENASGDVVVVPQTSSPTRRGSRTLTRTLGLKAGRIVLDPGHGGHDAGTIGPRGLREKDLVLDVSVKLKQMLESRLGAEVSMTRDSDRFVALEERTAIANQDSADLFVSVHANSSSNKQISGVETYILNFATNAAEREVASRENATAQKNIRDLEELVKKITLRDFIDESRELASIVQDNLYRGVRRHRRETRNRGVKQAPFIVLIGAHMPSVLAEISFISNPGDEKFAANASGRLRLAEALYAGIEEYFRTLGAVRVREKVLSESRR